MAADEWNYFLAALAPTSGTILAIALAVLLSGSKKWLLNPLKQAVTVLTVAQLSAPVFFALIALMPSHPWKIAGALVGVVGYAAIINHVVQYVQYEGHIETSDVVRLWLIILSVASFSVLLWIPSLAWKAGACVWMIPSGLIDCWLTLKPRE